MSAEKTSDGDIGKQLAKAIPEAGWLQIIDTACKTFTDILAPITATSAGVGALIQAKFDSMTDVQRYMLRMQYKKHNGRWKGLKDHCQKGQSQRY